MGIWRRMERPEENRTNETVLKILGNERKLVNIIVNSKKKWIRHELYYNIIRRTEWPEYCTVCTM